MGDDRKSAEGFPTTRTLARFELAVAFASPVVALLLWIAAPARPSGMRLESGPWLHDVGPDAVVAAGIAGVILGLVVMVRIYRADPEPGERTWRYKRF